MDLSLLNFLEKFLFDTLAIDLHYFTFPFSDISAVDRGLRKGLMNSNNLYGNVKEIFLKAENNVLYIVGDKYLLNYIILRPYKENNDIITVGPYLNRPINDELFIEIASLNGLNFAEIESIKGYIYRAPLFDNNMRLISLINDILEYINPEIGAFNIKDINWFSIKETEDYYIPQDDFEIYVDSVKKRYEIETELFNNVAAGNQVEALISSKRIKSLPFEQRLKDALYERKALLFSISTLLRKAAQSSEVHPLFLHQISSKYVKTIESLTTFSQLEHLNEEMIRSYCQLVKERGRIQYSPPIKYVLNTIELNLSKQFSLAEFSKELHISPPYLSSLFKKEVGVTITEYVNQQKISHAIKLLKKTKMQIQEIAYFVGIHDLNYFSKLFKKQTGCNPRDYRKNL